MPDISDKYRIQFLKRQLQYSREFKGIFDKIADQFAQFAYDPNIKFTKAFVFPPYIKDRIKVLMADFHDQALNLTESEIKEAWGLSNTKNDKLVTDYLRTISAIKASQEAAYFLPNTSALKAFLSNAHGTETLSDAIWNIGKQYRKELEIHLGLGVLNGDSAQTISRRIRTYLQNPEALFRRIRDNQGRLVASKAMIEFRKANGLTQGTYTSAFKNAMRTARSNANNAFHLADMLRWSQMDMVKGFKVSLSAQHKIYDICDECEGDYPKDFIFIGWHPQCLCHATPILTSQADFMTYLKTGQREVNKMVTQYPEGFKSFVKENYERFSNYKSVPFWMQDNEDVISDIVRKK